MFHSRSLQVILPSLVLIGCSGSGTVVSGGGSSAVGGAQPVGGATQAGGEHASGGVASSGGALSTTAASGGTAAGGVASGGNNPGGGASSIGGSNAAGGTSTGVAGGTKPTGGTSSTGGSKANASSAAGGAGVGGAMPLGGTSSTGGSKASAGAPAGGAATGGVAAGGSAADSCSSPVLRITEVDLGANVVTNETEATTTGTNLMVLALSPIPSGGSRLMWHGSDGAIHVTTLNADDTVNTSAAPVSIPGKDCGDVFADDNGGVLLVTREAQGSGAMHCGDVNNLCGATADLPTTIPCYDMYLVRFDGTSETWARKITSSSSTLPPYLTSPTDSTWNEYIWWYAHHGRIASDGTNFAAYFGSAVSVSQTCTDPMSALSKAVNIHQGDRMQIVDPSGALLTGHNSFDWGCSHSGYERIVWDPTARQFIMVCKNDAATGGKTAKIAFAPNAATILPVDNVNGNVGNIVLGSNGDYWLTFSDLRSGQPADTNGLDDVHLVHIASGAADMDRTLAGTAGANDRAPHLAKYGNSNILAAWEEGKATGDFAFKSTARTMYLQVLDRATGYDISLPFPVPATGANAIFGNRYQEFRSYPDGSVAYPSAGSSSSKVKILRVMPCQ